MEEIKRYDIDLGVWKDEDSQGEWVKYSDHKVVIEKMQNKIDELEKLKCCGNCSYWADSINGWYCTHSKKDTSNIDFRNSVCGNWMQVLGLKGIK